MIACTSEQALWRGTKRERPSALQESIFLTMAILLPYASQSVDDARVNHIVIDGEPAGIHHDIIDKEPSFFNMATCHSYSRIKTFNYSYMTGNTTPFHFVPGLKGENFPKKLRCTEESPVITTIPPLSGYILTSGFLRDLEQGKRYQKLPGSISHPGKPLKPPDQDV